MVLATAPVHDAIFQFLHMLLVLGSIPIFASFYTGATGKCCSCFCGLFPTVSVKTAFNAVAVDLTFLLMLWLLLLPFLLPLNFVFQFPVPVELLPLFTLL